jgi:hypothetical protein
MELGTEAIIDDGGMEERENGIFQSNLPVQDGALSLQLLVLTPP